MTQSERLDPTSLTYWFPKLEAAGLPVPKTRIIPMPLKAMECIWEGQDGNEGSDEQHAALQAFFAELTTAADEVGWPCFLRTDHTSAKHSWSGTCHLTQPADVPRHVAAIVEFSDTVDIMGLPYRHWAVREFLPTIPLAYCPLYGGMPVCREFRFFVDDGEIRCMHPYWPKKALEQGGASIGDYDALCQAPDEAAIRRLAEAAGRAVGGSWSIDILETAKGWFVTDMAEAGKSFHWEGCPHASKD